MVTAKQTLSALEKQFESLLCTPIRFANMLTKMKSDAIKHLPDKECIIDSVWKSSVILLVLSIKYPKVRKLIISTHASHQKNNWMTLLDKLTTCNLTDPNIHHMYLFQMLLRELISKEKDYRPYWTPAYKELSEKLLSPIEIDCVGSDLNFSKLSLKKVEEKLPFWTMRETKVQNRNLQKTCFQLSTSTVASKWEKEVTEPNLLKTLKIKLKINRKQKNVLDEWLNTSNFVYNKTVASIRGDSKKANFMSLRDELVTANTKKSNPEYLKSEEIRKNIKSQKKSLEKQLSMKTTDDALKDQIQSQLQDLEENLQRENEAFRILKKTLNSSKNEGIHEWELKTPKEIRAGSVNDVCKAYKTGFSNIKLGNIKHFRLGFRKKSESRKCLVLPKNIVKNNEGRLCIAPTYLGDASEISMGKKTIKKHRDLKIEHDCRLVKQRNEYWLLVPIPQDIQPKQKPVNYCGIDPGVKTFMTSFGNQGFVEYVHHEKSLKALDSKIVSMKTHRKGRRIAKTKIFKVEKRKENLIDELHWKTIHHLLKNNDFIFYGDIKSHDIVKDGKNRTLNTSMNNLKFYKFKQRLLFKSIERGKKVFEVKEHFTTKTCSNCGIINEPGLSRIYTCKKCLKTTGRDVNASKNILMKGIVENIL